MKKSFDLSRQVIFKLLNDPVLFKKLAMIITFLLLAVTLFGIIAGSLITARFFPGVRL